MHCSEAPEILYDYVFGLLEPDAERAVEAHLESCEACRVAHAEVLRERDLLKTWEAAAPPAGLANATLARIVSARAGAEQRKEALPMTANSDPKPAPVRPEHEPVELAWRWFGTRRFWWAAGAVAAVLLLALTVQSLWIVLRPVPSAEAFLFARSTLAPGQPAPFRVLVRDGRAGAPIAGAAVQLAIADSDGVVVLRTDASTDENGLATVDETLPDDFADGDYTVTVIARTDAGDAEVRRSLAAQRAFRILVTTDKPLYQPGQTIHIRALALRTDDGLPAADSEVVLLVKDANGNTVFRHRARSSAFGICSTDFELADQVNEGEYQIVAEMGDVTSERTVRVERYVLPRYRVDLTAERAYYAPSDVVSGNLVAEYTFGEPVADAAVEIVAYEYIEAFHQIAEVSGRTGADGSFAFTIPLKDYFVGLPRWKGDAVLSLEARVTDGAGHEQKQTLDLTISSRPIRVELFPESGRLVQGVENILYIFTAYPDGRPAKTTLRIGRNGETVETSPAGIAKVKITPEKANLELTIVATDEHGVRVFGMHDLRIGARSESILLRTDRAVYTSGGTVHITVLSADRAGRVFVDVLKDRRAALVKTVDVADGRGELALDLPPDLFGTLEINAYRVASDASITGDTRIIQVQRADELQIEAHLDREVYRPAETAQMTFAVTDPQGAPVVAALSLAGVDEAVFALHAMRPGLERMYFALQEELLRPRYQITTLPASPRDVVEPPTPERDEAAVVLFSVAAGSGEPPTMGASESYDTRLREHERRRRDHFSRLWAGIPLAAAVLFLLLTLPLIGYAARKLIKPTPPVSGSSVERHEVRYYTRALNLWWILGWYVPFGVLAALVILDRILYLFDYELLLTVIFGLSIVVMFVGLMGASIRLRRVSSLTNYPRFRALVALLPYAYVSAWLIPIGLVVSDYYYSARWEFGTIHLVITALFAAAVAFLYPALAICGAALQQRITPVRWLGIALTRSMLAIVPAILIAGMCLPALGRARYESLATRERSMMRARLAEEALAADEARPADPGPARVRRHFPETLFWQPELITDESGRAEMTVPLADSITTWRVAMSAVSARGELGSATAGIRVFQDFFVDIDFPVELTQNDHVSVPIAVYNYLDRPQTVRLVVEERPWFQLDGEPERTIEIGPRQVTSVSFPLAASRPGTHAFLVRAQGDTLADAVERSVRVRPDGRRIDQTVNGFLDGGRTLELVIPDDAIDGSLDLVAKIYPGAFSQVIEGIDGIFRMPFGCFEQTTSVTYPNILALDYLGRTNQIKPEVEMKALRFVALGYQRLLTFEVQGGGFDWFGRPPANVTLSAYGLMQFTDMARVHEVEPALIDRTREWLVGQQQRDGTWQAGNGRTRRNLTGDLRITAFVAWALAEAGESSDAVTRALDVLNSRLDIQAADTYTLALCANAMIAGKHPGTRQILAELEGRKKTADRTAWWEGPEGSTLMYGAGRAVHVETTALVAYALLRAEHAVASAHQALAWLIEQKDPHGIWHTTQATVYAMRALLAGTEPGAPADDDDDVHVAITANDQLARELTITRDNREVFHLVSLRPMVKKGANRVALETVGDSSLSYQIVATHYVPWSGEERPPAEKGLSIDVAYSTTELQTNDLLVATVTVEYHRSEPANMTIVDLGVPPGFDVVSESFAKLVEEGVIKRYELTGRQVILYFRTLPPQEPVQFEYALRAKFPVRAQTPQAVVYQYYEPAVRDVAEPVLLTVR